MSRYALRHEHLGSWPVVAMIDTVTGTAVRVARRGATVLEYLVPVHERLRNVVDGYATTGGMDTLAGSRFAVMCPFANRVADARYTFDGTSHDLAPGASGTARRILHGFLRDADFELVSMDTDAAGAALRLRSEAIRPGVFAGYPFAVDLEVTFTLNPAGLELEACMHNVGDGPAPCFFGWHPYLRPGGDGIGDLEMKLPARQAIVTDEGLIPLPGAAARRPLDDCPERDFRQWRRIGDTVLDHGFADLEADADGRIRSHLRDPESGLHMAMWQTSGVIQVFTGDTLAADAARRAVAIEPMQAMTDAFNRPDNADAITLAPGATRTFHCGLDVHAP